MATSSDVLAAARRERWRPPGPGGWLLVGVVSIACARGESPATAANDTTAAAIAASLDSGGRCFEATASILGRHLTPRDGPAGSSAPGGAGWVRLGGPPSADSGQARLVDADGSALGATWWRDTGSVVRVTGFDDFLRVELRLTLADSTASGTAVATSDAALERDSSGQLRDLRREWTVSARRAPCDSMPLPANQNRR